MTRIELSIEAPEGAMSLAVEGDDTLKLIRSAMARATAAYSVAAAEKAAEPPAPEPPTIERPQPEEGVQYTENGQRIEEPQFPAGKDLSSPLPESVGVHQGQPFDKSTGLPLSAEHYVPVEAIEGEPPFVAETPVQTAQENAGPKPWEAQEAAQAPAAPAKKGGRRTNEEIAAEYGVSLDDVKEWAGEGVRISKSKIEEFAKLHPAAVSMNNQDLQQAAEQPQAAPVDVVAALATDEDGEDYYDPAQDEGGFSDMPVEAFGGQTPAQVSQQEPWDPFGTPAPQQPAQAPAASDGETELPF